MNTFEDIQTNWLSQPVHDMVQPSEIQFVQSKWQKQQRKVLFSNLAMSAGFLAALIVIGWVYFSFRNQYGWPFEISIAAMYCLMIVFSIVAWKSYAFKKENLETSSADFIQYQLSKLAWQRKILTTYIWIYIVLLWLALFFYLIEVTGRGSLLFKLTALGGTTAYIVGISLWSWFRKNKKQLRLTDEIINELKQINNGLN
jgi:MFS family permease